MWSKKGLLVILVVAVAIFVGIVAFGLPWWQGLLFSIAFLLIAVIVFGGGGLVIPEALLGLRPPGFRRPQEADNKEDFLKRMDSDLAEFSAQPETSTDDVHWMTEYARVMKGVGELVYAVHEGVKSKDRTRQLRTFRDAVTDLPRLISQFRDIPELEAIKGKGTVKRQAQGLDLYLEACSDFAEAIEKNDGELAGEAAMQISQALDLLDIMPKEPTTAPPWW